MMSESWVIRPVREPSFRIHEVYFERLKVGDMCGVTVTPFMDDLVGHVILA